MLPSTLNGNATSRGGGRQQCRIQSGQVADVTLDRRAGPVRRRRRDREGLARQRDRAGHEVDAQVVEAAGDHGRHQQGAVGAAGFDHPAVPVVIDDLFGQLPLDVEELGHPGVRPVMMSRQCCSKKHASARRWSSGVNQVDRRPTILVRASVDTAAQPGTPVRAQQ
jgi:hypothetical protein